MKPTQPITCVETNPTHMEQVGLGQWIVLKNSMAYKNLYFHKLFKHFF